MITNTTFSRNPVVSSPMRGGGKSYSLSTDKEIGENPQTWRLVWQIPMNGYIADYSNGQIKILKGFDEYMAWPTSESQLSKIPKDMKDDIISQYNSLIEVEEVEVVVEMDIITLVQSQDVHGTTITMKTVENDYFRGVGSFYYFVQAAGVYDDKFDTQEEAEERFQYLVNWFSRTTDLGSIIDYNGVTIDFEDYRYSDNADTNQIDSVALYAESFPREEFVSGQELTYNDGFGVRTFGVITLDESVDIPMLKNYIDAKTTTREDPNPFVLTGLIDVQSFGWYNNDANKDSQHNPFSKVIMNEVFTLTNTDGRILGITDSDGWSDSGNLLLRVKEGYRVRLKLMTQNSGYFKKYIPNLDSLISHTQWEEDLVETYTDFDGDNLRYNETDKITFDMYGGDTLQVDIDDEYKETISFSITSNGHQLVGGAPSNIDDETFLAIIEVEKEVLTPSGSGSGTSLPPDLNGGGTGVLEGEETVTSKPMFGIAILVGSILIIGILWMVLRDGE